MRFTFQDFVLTTVLLQMAHLMRPLFFFFFFFFAAVVFDFLSVDGPVAAVVFDFLSVGGPVVGAAVDAEAGADGLAF